MRKLAALALFLTALSVGALYRACETRAAISDLETEVQALKTQLEKSK